jgi:endo-1,4-beta-xylanase
VQGRVQLLVLGLVAMCGFASASASPALSFERTGPVELGSAINDGAFSWGELHPYRDTFLRNHDAVTHEHSMKMMAVQPERGRWDFAPADAIADWSVRNAKKLHGHTLVWCRDKWTPAWVTSRTWTRAELLDVMTQHIRTVVRRYRGQASSWDVVNEALTPTGGREPCVWERYIGRDWIEQAFRAAAAADPDARLFYSEWAADTPNRKFVAMETMVKDLLARGVPLHGIGFQHHTYGFQPVQDRIEEAMARVAALGLAVHVSEISVPTVLVPGSTDDKLAQQAQAYETVAASCQAQPACFRLTTWGFVDGIGWRPAREMAAPFDTSYRPKPAWQAIQRVLRPSAAPAGNRAPSTPGTPTSSTPVAAKDLTVRWPAARDVDGQALTYTLQHRDADDASWTTVATGIRGTSFRFHGGRLEKQGTLTYRARADDGYVVSSWSGGSAPVKVDRTLPSAPAPESTRVAGGAESATCGQQQSCFSRPGAGWASGR